MGAAKKDEPLVHRHETEPYRIGMLGDYAGADYLFVRESWDGQNRLVGTAPVAI
jgi:hypothetical protein